MTNTNTSASPTGTPDRTLSWLLLSVIAYNASTGLDPWWAPAWIAPVGLLVASYRLRARTTAVAAWIVLGLGAARLFPFLTGVMPLPAVLFALALRALVLTLAVLLSRAAMRRLPAAVAVFAFPAVWTALEFGASAGPNGTALSLAYTQSEALALVQVASLAGVWPITFLVTLGGSALALAIVRRRPWILAVPAVVLVTALGFGAWRLSQPGSSPGTRVGLLATDAGAGVLFENADAKVALDEIVRYVAEVPRLARAGATVVVLPEKLVGVPPGAMRLVTEVLATSARDAKVTIVAGLNLTGMTPPRNVAVAFGPDGRALAEYDKHHMLPGPETGYLVGTRPGVFQVPGGPWGLAICKDMDFPAWSRAYGQLGVRVVAVPAWDFVKDGRLHARMAALRGVENGFAVVRTAIEGRLTVTDGYGRVVAERTSEERPFAVLATSVPPGPGPTFYTRTGDWFGWGSVLMALAIAAASLWRRTNVAQDFSAA